jgi:hypothetical protein
MELKRDVNGVWDEEEESIGSLADDDWENVKEAWLDGDDDPTDLLYMEWLQPFGSRLIESTEYSCNLKSDTSGSFCSLDGFVKCSLNLDIVK